jgi:hypothetical protein
VPFAYLPGFPHHAFVHTGVSKHVGKPVEYVRFGALTFPLGYSCGHVSFRIIKTQIKRQLNE